MPWPKLMLACSIGRHDLYGRTRPATAPGKPHLGCWPRPTLVNISHISCGGIDSAIFEVPMLDDFWMISCTSITPCAWVSWMVLSAMVKEPLPVSNLVYGVTRLLSSARPTVNGLSDEPGSKVSVIT